MTRHGYEEYRYRPSVGIASGLWSAGVPFGLPSDQRVDEIYAANYTSAPLDEPLEIIGMGKAVIHVSSTAPVMAFVARLSDVAPDGSQRAGHNRRAERNAAQLAHRPGAYGAG